MHTYLPRYSEPLMPRWPPSPSLHICLHCEWAFAHSSNSQLPTHDYFKGNIIICVQLVNNETLGQCLYFSLAATKSVVYPTWTLALFQQALLRRLKWFSRIGFLLLIWNRISLLVWLEVLEHFFFSEDQSYTEFMVLNSLEFTSNLSVNVLLISGFKSCYFQSCKQQSDGQQTDWPEDTTFT